MACYVGWRKFARIARFASAFVITIIVFRQIGAGSKEPGRLPPDNMRSVVTTVRDDNIVFVIQLSKTTQNIAENARIMVAENAGLKEVENAGFNVADGIGFKRAADLSSLCKNIIMTESTSDDKVRVSYSPNSGAVFCPMYKMASTFWTRVFKMMEFNGESKISEYRTPFDIAVSLAPASNQYYDIKNRAVQPNIDASSAFKFLFVRSPYSRLFSNYGDKIIRPTVAFFEAFGKPAVRRLRRGGEHSSGSDVTFAEFVDEVVFQYRKLGKVDNHVAKYSNFCRPCSMEYAFVGKLETFRQDTNDVLSVLGQHTTLDIFETNFTVLHAQDVIYDVTHRAFTQGGALKRYMQWPDVLRRIWRQLQVRGVINQARFPLTSKQADIITLDEFRRLINDARLISKPEETKRLKKLAFIEAFRSVPASLMAEIRDIYKEEFLLFQYDTMPEELYDKDRKIEAHGFLNFSNIDEDLQPRGVFI